MLWGLVWLDNRWRTMKLEQARKGCFNKIESVRKFERDIEYCLSVSTNIIALGAKISSEVKEPSY